MVEQRPGDVTEDDAPGWTHSVQCTEADETVTSTHIKEYGAVAEFETVVEDTVTHLPELVEVLLRILGVAAEPALEQPTRPPILFDHVAPDFRLANDPA
jgi:hypothetical protein